MTVRVSLRVSPGSGYVHRGALGRRSLAKTPGRRGPALSVPGYVGRALLCCLDLVLASWRPPLGVFGARPESASCTASSGRRRFRPFASRSRGIRPRRNPSMVPMFSPPPGARTNRWWMPGHPPRGTGSRALAPNLLLRGPMSLHTG
eukprot:1195839-Prorocentrum_minimum.AAC.10